MELKKIIEQCKDALQETARTDDYHCERDFICTNVDTNDGWFDIGYFKRKGTWVAEVTVYHDYENEDNPKGYGRECPNLEKYLSEQLKDCIDWDNVEEYWREQDMDEWQWNGFRDEADFWRWKEGR